MKSISIDKKSKDAGVYVSVLCLYNMVQQPYQDCEVGDRFFYSITHYANSMDDADRRAKVYYAKEIFADDDIELFGVHSMKVTAKLIQTIIDKNEQSSIRNTD